MIESVIPVAIAIVSGGAVLTTRMHNRMHEMDQRVDKLELTIVSTYVSKPDFQAAIERVENAMIRMEDKIDVMVQLSKK